MEFILDNYGIHRTNIWRQKATQNVEGDEWKDISARKKKIRQPER